MTDTPSPADVEGQAQREALELTEHQSSLIRLVLVVFAALTYGLLLDPQDTIPWLAYTTIGLAGAYSLYLLVAKPYETYDVLLAPALVSAADTILIGTFIVATGGFESPFYLLWYAAIFAAALRYNEATMAWIATLYALAYTLIVAAEGVLVENGPFMVIRVGFVYILGALGAMLSGVTRDQAVAKKSYEELSARWEHQASLLEAALEATEDGILIVDQEDGVVAYNDRFRAMWRIPEELAKTRDDQALIEYVQDQLEEPEQFTEKIEELYGNPHQESQDVLRFKDGRVLERYSSPQYVDEEPIGRVWSFRDVTETYDNREALERSNQRLDRFAQIASHDLREPLRTLAGHLSLLDEQLDNDIGPDARESLSFAMKAAERMQTLIDGLLAYARIETPQEPETIPLEEPLEQALDQLSTRIEEEDATIDYGALPSVKGNASQLVQVFQNLIANALKYRSEQAPYVRIEARDAVPNRAEIVVEDNGQGVPEGEEEIIFEMFHQGSNQAGNDGSGIGLALVREIVRRHGGEIRAERRPKGGSRFIFTLPRA